MIQYHRFTSGGFVLHKVTIPGSKLHWSAWFDSNGILTDAESINAHKSVKRLTSRMVKIRQQLQNVGNRYKGEN